MRKTKFNLIIVMSLVLTMSLAACSKTTVILPSRKGTPPGQVKKQTAPGQIKKTTGSKSAKPYAPGQQKKKATK